METALEAAGVGALLPDWSERRRGHLLAADLAELGVEPPEAIAPPGLASEASLWGALYVLEGSRLGGALLKRSLAPGAPCRFLDAPQQAGAWRKLLAKLEECLYDPARVGAACETAKQVFKRFEYSGRRYLEFAA
jgi:heme oxygenase